MWECSVDISLYSNGKQKMFICGSSKTVYCYTNNICWTLIEDNLLLDKKLKMHKFVQLRPTLYARRGAEVEQELAW